MKDYNNINNKIMKQLRKKPFTKFWKDYIYKDTAVSHKTPYHNMTMNKLPCDFFIYPDIFYNYNPTTVVEIGTNKGGSAIWFSDLIHGCVITIDINKPVKNILNKFKKENIIFIHGDATTEKVYNQVEKLVDGKCIVIDDGSHKTQDVYNSFKLFNDMIDVGGFYIIEDGMSALLFKDRPKTMPNDAIDQILKTYSNFELYTVYDKFVFTSMFRGILKKTSR